MASPSDACRNRSTVTARCGRASPVNRWGWNHSPGVDCWVARVEEWVALRSSSAANVWGVETAIEFRGLERSELSLISEIDRTERIEVLYDQQGGLDGGLARGAGPLGPLQGQPLLRPGEPGERLGVPRRRFAGRVLELLAGRHGVEEQASVAIGLARVLETRVRSRPSIRHLTRYRRLGAGVPLADAPTPKTWTFCGASLTGTASYHHDRSVAVSGGTTVVRAVNRVPERRSAGRRLPCGNRA